MLPRNSDRFRLWFGLSVIMYALISLLLFYCITEKPDLPEQKNFVKIAERSGIIPLATLFVALSLEMKSGSIEETQGGGGWADHVFHRLNFGSTLQKLLSSVEEDISLYMASLSPLSHTEEVKENDIVLADLALSAHIQEKVGNCVMKFLHCEPNLLQRCLSFSSSNWKCRSIWYIWDIFIFPVFARHLGNLLLGCY